MRIPHLARAVLQKPREQIHKETDQLLSRKYSQVNQVKWVNFWFGSCHHPVSVTVDKRSQPFIYHYVSNDDDLQTVHHPLVFHQMQADFLKNSACFKNLSLYFGIFLWFPSPNEVAVCGVLSTAGYTASFCIPNMKIFTFQKWHNILLNISKINYSSQFTLRVNRQTLKFSAYA